jgi:hypothetical protein
LTKRDDWGSPIQAFLAISSAHPTTRTGDETLQIVAACATIPVRLQRHLRTLSAATASAQRDPISNRDGRPLRGLASGHRARHCRLKCEQPNAVPTTQLQTNCAPALFNQRDSAALWMSSAICLIKASKRSISASLRSVTVASDPTTASRPRINRNNYQASAQTLSGITRSRNVNPRPRSYMGAKRGSDPRPRNQGAVRATTRHSRFILVPQMDSIPISTIRNPATSIHSHSLAANIR